MASTKRQRLLTDKEIVQLREAAKRDITPKNMQPELPSKAGDNDRFDRVAVKRAAGIWIQNF